jgi:hypothetical protein
MILNPFALTLLFVGTISLLLMAASAISALYFYHQYKHSEGIDEQVQAQSRIHLSLLLLFTAFLLRLATWPLFYILLHSLVPIVPGAMCIYGVTQVMPAFIAFMQTLKPLAFFLVGGWLLFHSLDLCLRNHPLMSKSIRLLIFVLVVAAIDSISELLFIFLFSPPGVAVSCCTVVADLMIPASPLIPVPLFSAHYRGILMAGYHGINLGLVALISFLIWKKNTKRMWLILVAISSMLNGIIAYGAFKEYLGPRLMHLPDHHCLYCMFQYRPISIIIVGLFVLGSFLAVWPLWLRHAASLDEAEEQLALLNLNLLKCSAACLLISGFLRFSHKHFGAKQKFPFGALLKVPTLRTGFVMDSL